MMCIVCKTLTTLLDLGEVTIRGKWVDVDQCKPFRFTSDSRRRYNICPKCHCSIIHALITQSARGDLPWQMILAPSGVGAWEPHRHPEKYELKMKEAQQTLLHAGLNQLHRTSERHRNLQSSGRQDLELFERDIYCARMGLDVNTVEIIWHGPCPSLMRHAHLFATPRFFSVPRLPPTHALQPAFGELARAPTETTFSLAHFPPVGSSDLGQRNSAVFPWMPIEAFHFRGHSTSGYHAIAAAAHPPVPTMAFAPMPPPTTPIATHVSIAPRVGSSVIGSQSTFKLIAGCRPIADSMDTPGDCPICVVSLNHLDAGDKKVTTNCCGHFYHYNCLLQAVEYRTGCPDCRSTIIKLKNS